MDPDKRVLKGLSRMKIRRVQFLPCAPSAPEAAEKLTCFFLFDSRNLLATFYPMAFLARFTEFQETSSFYCSSSTRYFAWLKREGLLLTRLWLNTS